jgi:hypothetical protein
MTLSDQRKNLRSTTVSFMTLVEAHFARARRAASLLQECGASSWRLSFIEYEDESDEEALAS